jgi:hypothetical protein
MLTLPRFALGVELVNASQVISSNIFAKIYPHVFADGDLLLLPVDWCQFGLRGGANLFTSDVLQALSLQQGYMPLIEV